MSSWPGFTCPTSSRPHGAAVLWADRAQQEYASRFRGAIRGTKDWWNGGRRFGLHGPVRAVPDAGRWRTASTNLQHIEDRAASADCGRLLEAGPLPSCRIVRRPTEELHKRLERVSTKETVVNRAKGGRASLHCDRHSLGAALTTLFVMENEEKKKFDITTSCKFASPALATRICANFQFAAHRVVAHRQLLGSGAQAPASHSGILDYEHVNTAYEFSSRGCEDEPGVLAFDGNLFTLAGREPAGDAGCRA